MPREKTCQARTSHSQSSGKVGSRRGGHLSPPPRMLPMPRVYLSPSCFLSAQCLLTMWLLFLLPKRSVFAHDVAAFRAPWVFCPNLIFSTRLGSKSTSSRKPSLMLFLALHLLGTLYIVLVIGSSLTRLCLSKRFKKPGFVPFRLCDAGQALSSVNIIFFFLCKMRVTSFRYTARSHRISITCRYG